MEITQPTDLERGEVNETTLALDLDTLNEHQLRSHAEALRIDNARKGKRAGELQKAYDEMTSTCEAQFRTISEQSETLENRQKLVDESQSAHLELLEREVELNDQIEALRQSKSEELPVGHGSQMAAELTEALEHYGINCARIAANDTHNAVAVAFIQIAARIRSEGWTWYQAITWLRTRE